MSTNKISGKKRDRDDGGGKGLRHFSLMVCKKVEEKGQTTYNEVADELVAEFTASNNDDDQNDEGQQDTTTTGKKSAKFDVKNIRRRVYDALNVLMAMDIISKEKKQIKWIGLPNSSCENDLDQLYQEKEKRRKEVQKKRDQLRELLLQQICYHNLVQRNKTDSDGSTETSEKNEDSNDDTKIPLPFLAVSVSNQSMVECEMSPEQSEVFFNFSKPFEINDDSEILKRLNMHQTTADDLRQMLPSDLHEYCQKHHLLADLLPESDGNKPSSKEKGKSNAIDGSMAFKS